MSTLVLLIRMVVATVTAVATQAVRRLRRGAVTAGWSWSMELTVVGLRAIILTAMEAPDIRTVRRLERLVDPPVAPSLRDVVVRSRRPLGPVAADRITLRSARLLRPGMLLYLHGGGYVSGSPATHRQFVSRLAWAVRLEAVVPWYRLAPEYPFPAALEDAVGAYRALLTEGHEPDRIVVAGDSAGGGLALALMVRLGELGLPRPAAAVLFSPYTDLEHTGGSLERNRDTDYLPVMAFQPNREYLGALDPRTPLASPLYSDLRGLPPLLVFAGSKEMILDDSVRLADRAKAAGVEVDLRVFSDMMHVWPALFPRHRASLEALAEVDTYIERHVR